MLGRPSEDDFVTYFLQVDLTAEDNIRIDEARPVPSPEERIQRPREGNRTKERRAVRWQTSSADETST